MLRIKLRFKFLIPAVLLIAGAVVVGIKALPSPRPCIASGVETLESASAPWHADLHVGVTDDPSPATVRVAATDNAAGADFAMIDHANGVEANACEATPATQFLAVSARPQLADPL